MITALNVANYILVQSKKEGIDITPMKLQKLIYILYKEYLKETRRKLFDEEFLVWQYGPVLSSVYNAFSKYKANHIRECYSEKEESYTTITPNKNFNKVFDMVWEKHKYQNGVYLSMLTQQKNTAWKKALDNNYSILMTQDIFDEATYKS